jgi:hypothetical protein
MKAALADRDCPNLHLVKSIGQVGCSKQRVPFQTPIVIMQQSKDISASRWYDLRNNAMRHGTYLLAHNGEMLQWPNA